MANTASDQMIFTIPRTKLWKTTPAWFTNDLLKQIAPNMVFDEEKDVVQLTIYKHQDWNLTPIDLKNADWNFTPEDVNATEEIVKAEIDKYCKQPIWEVFLFTISNGFDERDDSIHYVEYDEGHDLRTGFYYGDVSLGFRLENIEEELRRVVFKILNPKIIYQFPWTQDYHIVFDPDHWSIDSSIEVTK